MMNKLYRGISRVRQQLNYLIAKQRLIDKNNQLSKIDIDLERLPDKLVAGMAKGLRVNKKFPAGKSIYIDVEGEELIIEDYCINSEGYLTIWIIGEPQV